MNMFKKNGGFTLVELIVVIAILAILAGVAVPAYTGYINKAKEAGDLQVVSAINTAIQAANATKNPAVVPSVTQATDGTLTIAFSDTGVQADFTTYIGQNSLKLEVMKIGTDLEVNTTSGLIVEK